MFVSLFHLRFIQFALLSVSFKFKVYVADGSHSWRSVSGNTAHTLTAESCDMGMVFTFNCFRFNKYKFNKYIYILKCFDHGGVICLYKHMKILQITPS